MSSDGAESGSEATSSLGEDVGGEICEMGYCEEVGEGSSAEDMALGVWEGAGRRRAGYR